MATAAMRALQSEQINKVNLIAFKKNELAINSGRKKAGKMRDDVNYYDFVLNDEKHYKIQRIKSNVF